MSLGSSNLITEGKRPLWVGLSRKTRCHFRRRRTWLVYAAVVSRLMQLQKADERTSVSAWPWRRTAARFIASQS